MNYRKCPHIKWRRSMSALSIDLYGPYHKHEHQVNLPYTAYLIVQKSSDTRLKICLIAQEKQQEILEKIVSNSAENIIAAILTQVPNEFQNWQEIPCYVGIIHKDDSDDTYTLSLSGFEADKNDPLELVREVMMTLSLIYRETVEGQEYIITQYASDLGDRLYTYRVQPSDRQIGQTVHAKNLEELKAMIPLMGETREIDDELYFQETLHYIQNNNLNAAFYSFYFVCQFYNPLEVEDVVSLGLTLGNTMLMAMEYDYADWVATKVADIAGSNSDWDAYVRAMRLAGISASAMGRIADVKEYFSKAVERLELVSDSDIAILLHMSYGLAIVEQFAHWEVENCHVPNQGHLDANGSYFKGILDAASEHLKLAKEMIVDSRDDGSEQKLCAIELDLIRVSDLNGESAEALQNLDNYVRDRKFVRTDKLMATAILYRSLILKKLRDFNIVSQPVYLDALNQGMQELTQLESPPGDRLWSFSTLVGDALIEQEQFSEAVAVFEKALVIRETTLGEIIRVPHPGNDFSGLPLIDVAGRVQSAYLLLAHQEQESAYIWNALHIADGVKGKFFRRNLTMAVHTKEPSLKGLLSARYRAIKSNLLSSQEEHRIIMAEYTRFLEQDLSSEQAKIFNETNADYELGVDREELSNLLHSDNYNTAYLSLYANKNTTYFYLLSKPANAGSLFHLEAFSLDISLDFLTKVFQHLYIGIHGDNTIHNPLKAHDPYKKDKKYFFYLAELRKKLEPLVSNLTKFEHIVISPYGIWHKLPIHALILPVFWAGGLNPGISYTPSIHAFNLLKRRADNKKPFVHQRIGLATVRAIEEEAAEPEFAEAHAVLKSILGRTGRNVVDFYGCEATPEKLLDTLNEVGVMHILAHGSHDVEGNSIRSRLHLASEFGLPFKPMLTQPGENKGYRDREVLSGDAMMMGGTAAEHITLQACSLGRFEIAFGDELWGMGRALLAGGADSVLLAMWNVDRISSTTMVRLFYENWLIHKLPKWKALANAQLQIFQDEQHPAWSHFYHWGALQLIGV